MSFAMNGGQGTPCPYIRDEVFFHCRSSGDRSVGPDAAVAVQRLVVVPERLFGLGLLLVALLVGIDTDGEVEERFTAGLALLRFGLDICFFHINI